MSKKEIDRTEIKMCIAELLCEHHKNFPLENISFEKIQTYLKQKNITKGTSYNIIKEVKEEAIKECLRVSVSLKSPRNLTYQEELLTKYAINGLKNAVVIDIYPGEKTIDALGRTAAEFFEFKVKNGDIVVLSCGTTINSMIKNINKSKNYKNIKVISSIALCVDSFQNISPSALIHNFISKFPESEGFAYQIPTNFVNEISPKKLNRILQNEVFSRAIEADYFFLGIGSLSKDDNNELTASFNALINKLGCYDDFKEAGCCGEISYWPIANKKYNDSYWLKNYTKIFSKSMENFDHLGIIKYFRVVYTVNFDEIIKRRTAGTLKGKVIAVAGGRNKARAIDICLKINNFIHTLITDSETAQQILKF